MAFNIFLLLLMITDWKLTVPQCIYIYGSTIVLEYLLDAVICIHGLL